MKMNRINDIRNPHFVPDFKEKACSLSSVSLILAVDFFIDAL